MESYELMVFVFVTLGVGILVSELFIPSAGLLSVMAVGCFLASGFCAWRAWYATGEMLLWWLYVFGMLAILPTGVAAAVHLLPRTSFGKHLFVAPLSSEELTPFQDEEHRLCQLINHSGTAATMFSPGGMALIGAEKFHAESEGVIIEAGAEVVVVGVRSNRLVVRPAEMCRNASGPLSSRLEPSGLDSGVMMPDLRLAEARSIESPKSEPPKSDHPNSQRDGGGSDQKAFPDRPIDFDMS